MNRKEFMIEDCYLKELVSLVTACELGKPPNHGCRPATYGERAVEIANMIRGAEVVQDDIAMFILSVRNASIVGSKICYDKAFDETYSNEMFLAFQEEADDLMNKYGL